MIVYKARGRNGFDRILFLFNRKWLLNLNGKQFKLTDNNFNTNALAFA